MCKFVMKLIMVISLFLSSYVAAEEASFELFLSADSKNFEVSPFNFLLENKILGIAQCKNKLLGNKTHLALVAMGYRVASIHFSKLVAQKNRLMWSTKVSYEEMGFEPGMSSYFSFIIECHQ